VNRVGLSRDSELGKVTERDRVGILGSVRSGGSNRNGDYTRWVPRCCMNPFWVRGLFAIETGRRKEGREKGGSGKWRKEEVRTVRLCEW